MGPIRSLALPYVTLCERPTVNSLTHTTNLESVLEATIFESSPSYYTKPKAPEKSNVIASILGIRRVQVKFHPITDPAGP